MNAKRKTPGTITDFFKPAKSTKIEATSELVQTAGEAKQVRWKLEYSALLKCNYRALPKFALSDKLIIAAFDLDSTLVSTKTSMPFPRDGSDWKYQYESVRNTMRAIEELKTLKHKTTKYSKLAQAMLTSKDTYVIAILSNQGSVVAKENMKRYEQVKERIKQIIQDVDIPVRVYCATKVDKKDKGSDKFRKPATGMWDALINDLKKESGIDEVDLSRSFFVGDAAGRKQDFSNSDIKFAEAVGLRFYTPEDFFLN